MAEMQLKIEVGPAREYNYELPDNQGFTLQQVALVAENPASSARRSSAQDMVAEAGAYLESQSGKYWTAWWSSNLSVEKLVGLTEGTIQEFECQFPNGVKKVDEKIENIATPKVEELLWKLAAVAGLDIAIEPRKPLRGSIHVHIREEHRRWLKDVSGPERTFPLQRPLSWERLRRLVDDEDISLLNFNSRVGCFSIQMGRRKKVGSYGFSTNSAETGPFATLLQQTAGDDEIKVSPEEAKEFLAAVTGLFTAGKE